MPIEKFKSFEEAERALWLPSGHPECVERWAALLTLSQKMHPNREVVRGVKAYSSVFELPEADWSGTGATSRQ